MSANLKSLVLFVTVADHGSISEGAKRCHIALAAASKRISDLEARAQRPLLVRHARGVTLTSAGHGLLRHARSVLSAMDRLSAEFGDFQSGVTGVVSITANASTIAQFLPECLPYRSDELAVVIGRGHPLARRKRISVAEVLQQEHIVVRERTALHRVLLAAALEAQVPLKVRMQVGSIDMVCRMVEQGIGIGVLPHAAILPQLQTLRVRCLKLDAPWAMRSHLLCVRKHEELTAATRSVLEYLGRPE